MPNYVEKSAYCPTCQQQRLVRRKAVSGGMGFVHTLLSVVTLGAWLLVWRSHAEARQLAGYRCATCGTKIGELSDGPPLAQQISAGTAAPADLGEVLKRDLGAVERLSLRQSIRAAAETLRPSELALAAAAGQADGINVLWVVSDQRVIKFSAATAEDLPRADSARAEVGPIFGKVTLATGAGPIELKRVSPPKQAEIVAAAVGRQQAAADPGKAPEKECPRCAETVKGAAKVCRYCGHDFDAGPES